MPEALAVALPLTLAVVLIASAVAKFRTPDDLAGWKDLGVPRVFQRDWLRRAHPWGEFALGLAIALLGGVLGLLASLAAVALMGAYTWLVGRAARRGDDTSCACFGRTRRITKVTVARNIWLTVLAVVTAATSWTTPILGGPLREGIPAFGWLLGLAAAGVTAVLILWPDSREDTTSAVPSASAPAMSVDEEGEELEYVRTRTPAVPVTLADGSVQSLRALAEQKPILLLAVSPTCGSCASVIARVDEYRGLLPEVDVRFLLRSAPDDSTLIEQSEPQSLHDVNGYVSGSIHDWPTPTAVLLGTDGMLAGGPVIGDVDIDAFIDDVYESLHGERPIRQAAGDRV